jgi:hypothetical protein
MGRPLFAGSGQLAVLLAIRDCRIDPLREARAVASAGALRGAWSARSRAIPAPRFPDGGWTFRRRSSPFDANPAASRARASARSCAGSRALPRSTTGGPTGCGARTASPQGAGSPDSRRRQRRDSQSDEERTTGEYAPIPSYVVQGTGNRLGPWTFARLVEGLATGQVGRGDLVDYLGRGLQPLENIEDLARFLPSDDGTTTNRLAA